MPADYYLRNQWYVAAFSGELSGRPVARTVCDIPMVLFRGADGAAGALVDRCPHRMAPLSSGEVCGNDIRCGYHGIAFGRDGACTSIPGGRPPPKDFAARSFPVEERHGFVWAWLGERAADPALIPDFFENADPAWAPVRGYLHIAANYELMVDNLLDLTHVVFVHKTTLAGGGVTETPLEVTVEGDRVHAQRMMHDVETAPVYRQARGLHGRIDRWQIFDFEPPMYIKITLGAREAGSEMPMGEPVHVVLNALTPESETTMHYFWVTSRPWGLGDARADEVYRTVSETAFNEDKAIVEAQQRLILSDPAGGALVSLHFDRAGAAARRIVQRLRDEEKGAAQAAE